MNSFNIGSIEIPITLYNSYINDLINRIFKILPIYEDCSLSISNDFNPYVVHIEKLILQLNGSDVLLGDKTFLILSATLTGLLKEEKITHKKVRSIVLHCTDLISKLKKKEV